MRVYLIGAGPGDAGQLTADASRAVASCGLLVGAGRLLEPFADLPCEKRALVRAADIAQALRSSDASCAAVLFSGDTGFYSGAGPLRPLLDGFEVVELPGISSLQCLCSRVGMPWQGAHLASAHGRDCNAAALVRQHGFVGLLTGGDAKAHDLCAQLVEAGLGEVRAWAGERLSYPDERVVAGTAAELSQMLFSDLTALLLLDAPASGAPAGGKPALLPRLLVASTGSGAGKTSFTCGLLRALQRRGLNPLACKCGPDYIDPLFHRSVVGVPSRNIDLFLMGADVARDQVADAGEGFDLAVIEGAMGYYDGIATTDEASSWDVARATGSPAVLLVDARGKARSVAAEVLGFARLRARHGIAGIVLNRASASYYPQLKCMIEDETGIPVVGYLPVLEGVGFESRHLGLVMADELDDLQGRVDRLADAVESSVDVGRLLSLAGAAGSSPVRPDRAEGAPCSDSPRSLRSLRNCARDALVPSQDRAASEPVRPGRTEGDPCSDSPRSLRSLRNCARDPLRPPGAAASEGGRMSGAAASKRVGPVRIAVARDLAFCFYYEASLKLLQDLGAQLVEFSPLRDAALPPDVDGLYLGGGYPELHAAELAANESMVRSVAVAVGGGLPTIAECGGFLYLHETLEGADGADYELVGAVPGRAFKTGRLSRFGYVELHAAQGGMLAGAGGVLRAHEFHYWDSTNPGSAFAARKPHSTRSWECAHVTDTLYAGFPHLCLAGAPEAAERFVAACMR